MMNLPVTEVAVHALRGSRVRQNRESENSNVVRVRTTRNTCKMLICIYMRCIVITPKISKLTGVNFVLFDNLIVEVTLGVQDELVFIICGFVKLP